MNAAGCLVEEIGLNGLIERGELRDLRSGKIVKGGVVGED